MIHEQEEDRSATRIQNRALRTMTRKLRRQVRKLQEKADEIFLSVCETETESERAFRELWQSERFNCDPKDYDHMVEETLRVFEKVDYLKAKVAILENTASN